MGIKRGGTHFPLKKCKNGKAQGTEKKEEADFLIWGGGGGKGGGGGGERSGMRRYEKRERDLVF